jgi:ankyrin repeat protein
MVRSKPLKAHSLKSLLNDVMDESIDWTSRLTALRMLHNRIMTLPLEELRKQSVWVYGEDSLLHMSVADLKLPLDAIARLCSSLGVDYTDDHGYTAIMFAAQQGENHMVEYLARDLQADL